MAVAVLCDIHGNLPALRAVLEDIEREAAEAIVIGGDVATGPLPAETLVLLASLGDRALFVRGNADREILEACAHGLRDVAAAEGPTWRAAAYAASRINEGQRDFLASFAERVELDIEGLGPTLFCHGSPRSDSESITTATSDDRLRSILGGSSAKVVVCGHTHRQFDRRIDGRRVVNAGAVGMPYEGRRGAYWALLGPDVALRRTEYDHDAAMAELRAGGFSDTDEMLLESLLEPADPDEVAEFFERQAH